MTQYAVHCSIFWRLSPDYMGDELKPGLQQSDFSPSLTAKCTIISLKPHNLEFTYKNNLHSRKFKGHWQVG